MEKNIEFYESLTGWTESRAYEGRMRHFWEVLRRTGEYKTTISIDVLCTASLRKVSEILYEDTHGRIDVWWVRLIEWFDTREDQKTRPLRWLDKHIKKEYQIKLEKETKEKLGQHLKLREPQKITVLFTLGCEGEAEDYYHERSCYWGSIASSRDYIECSGGGAVRMYDSDNALIARSWFVPYDGDDLKSGFVIFNAYGIEDMQHISRHAEIISEAINIEYQNTSARFTPDNSDELYLNSDNTYFIGVVDKQFNKRAIVYIHFNRPDKWKYGHKKYCPHCEEIYPEDYGQYISFCGDWVCEDCIRAYYTLCDFGYYAGNLISNSHLTEVEKNGVVGTIWKYDDDVRMVDNEYYHVSNLVLDYFGDWHIKNQDTYVIINSRVYPKRICKTNEKGEWILCK